MACRAAQRAAKRALIEIGRRSDRFVAGTEVWLKVKWWTPLTIEEACDELAFEQQGVVCHKGPFGKHYRAVDYDAGVRYNKHIPAQPEG